MSNDNNFIKFLINEEVYVIDDLQTAPNSNSSNNTQTESNSSDQVTPAVPKNDIAILFSNSASENMKVEESTLLLKILTAVKMSFENVDLVNAELGLDAISSYKKVVIFTANHDLAITNKYQMQRGEQDLLLADDLTTIGASVDLKKQLWGELQKMFA